MFNDTPPENVSAKGSTGVSQERLLAMQNRQEWHFKAAIAISSYHFELVIFVA